MTTKTCSHPLLFDILIRLGYSLSSDYAGKTKLQDNNNATILDGKGGISKTIN